MSFPARERFDREDASPLSRVYAYCRRVLRFDKPREIKRWAIARELRIDAKDITRLLDTLVVRRYLIELPREHPKAPRRFLLVYDELADVA